MSAGVRLRPALMADARAINDIYNHYVRACTCTFQEAEEPLAGREAWLARHAAPHVALVAEEADGTVAGWGALSPFHERSAWRFTAEDSVYLRHDRRGRGLGRLLLGGLLDAARAGGLRSVVASIESGQAASLALHRGLGFRDAGLLQRAGFKCGRWLDVAYLQKDLDGPA